ncbi:esterase [Myroides marinus]|uniref:alpha/beta hydrolase-fold protein n=1 Tax=Myroides marinus TaxID=703342 RepID=UPI002574D241|nr:alpha/beta hydrolase-fold protein [Myroides marinus]MDM1346163.1 esterase [Myroides marinus]MDM1351150.1 esterase [Myroides marinus]MDM1353417.1 esterase [Myroides marinus]MDM1358334.1 esterase [Myroides marinus]MDM1362743.1 esterase [Myroides marinus]
MKKYVFIVLMMVMSMQAQNSYKVRFEVSVEDFAHTDERIYLTGNFNQWNPQDERYLLQRDSQVANLYTIEVEDIPHGVLEYKFTRGTWQSLESSNEGRLVNLHDVVITSDTVLHNTIPAWRDQFRASTAPDDLIVLKNFYMPELNRVRDIRIYLPKDYKSSHKEYPVWYMHDGQDLFDEATSEGRLGPVEWEVDETIEQYGDQYIIVGIDHDYEKNLREVEYSFFSTQKNPKAEGQQYIAFIVKTLKPYIDTTYRTKKEVKYTGIAGGSLGGLISLYAGLTYPETFGKIGVFSPSIWQDDDNLDKYVANLTSTQLEKIQQQKYYIYGGGRENRKKGDGKVVKMDEDILRFLETNQGRLKLNHQLNINPKGKHGAWYWQQAFNWMIKTESNNF